MSTMADMRPYLQGDNLGTICEDGGVFKIPDSGPPQDKCSSSLIRRPGSLPLPAHAKPLDRSVFIRQPKHQLGEVVHLGTEAEHRERWERDHKECYEAQGLQYHAMHATLTGYKPIADDLVHDSVCVSVGCGRAEFVCACDGKWASIFGGYGMEGQWMFASEDEYRESGGL
jgi:hypothetical protein